MSDRELELAAKAAGYKIEWREVVRSRIAELGVIKHTKHGGFYINGKEWNPRDDNSDALMLMARLNINVFYRENINGAFVIADHCDIECCAESLDGPHEDDATRHAILRVAAKIGEGME